jgi:hypothetical protein
MLAYSPHLSSTNSLCEALLVHHGLPNNLIDDVPNLHHRRVGKLSVRIPDFLVGEKILNRLSTSNDLEYSVGGYWRWPLESETYRHGFHSAARKLGLNGVLDMVQPGVVLLSVDEVSHEMVNPTLDLGGYTVAASYDLMPIERQRSRFTERANRELSAVDQRPIDLLVAVGLTAPRMVPGGFAREPSVHCIYDVAQALAIFRVTLQNRAGFVHVAHPFERVFVRP